MGPKTAQKILSVGSIDTIFKNELINGKLYDTLKENEFIINRNINLITMKNDIRINCDLDKCRNKIDANLKAMDIIKASGVF